ncbi:amino acid transporter [Acidisarcina polymorpha]|uniref:Amino acid transporter n=1 Tax=Acidisarcina polymorpha TaxID=2211140 RepID=A0A2Z5FVY1_9BACT|nr:APC family permease [Acidisarcina polymorpha]AXC11049.1 amino acid transporter [Acidisarcina polymorpha]
MRKLRLLPLVAATYFMVSGGPYGLEDIVGQAGYLRALLLLAVVPLVWSLPTALMIGELASAMPEEGGFYVWVSRAFGRFWGFQEAWLSLSASVFDMAIYPSLAVAYLGQLSGTLTSGHRGIFWSLAIVLICIAWNLRGAHSVGNGSVMLFALLLTPFLAIIGYGFYHAASAPLGVRHFSAIGEGNMTTALLFVLWNCMGWDNASTIAREVNDPRRNYIRAMIGAVVVVTVSYVLPIGAVALTGIPAASFATGAWVDAARLLAGPMVGPSLAVAVVIGGAMTGVAMFNALTLSYARVPAAMARDGLLPKPLARHMDNGVPWVSVLICGLGWALALGLNLTRLLELDLMLYGFSLILEFAALIALRLKEPEMARPFAIPGGLPVAIGAGLGPTALILFAIWNARGDHLTPGLPAILLGAIIAVAGPILYALTSFARPRARQFTGEFE